MKRQSPNIRIELKDQSDPAYIEEVSDWLALDALKREFGDRWDDAMQKLWEETLNERKEVLNALV
jgi:hypothetical protein